MSTTLNIVALLIFSSTNAEFQVFPMCPCLVGSNDSFVLEV